MMQKNTKVPSFQVIAGCSYPPLLEQGTFPADVVERCKSVLDAVHWSVGCYSPSNGVPLIQKHVAEFIEKRDGYPSNVNNIIITNGASSSVKVNCYSVFFILKTCHLKYKSFD